MGGVGRGGGGLGVFLDHFWGSCLPVEEVWICALFFVFCGGLVLYYLWPRVGRGRGWYRKGVNVRRWIAKGRMQVVVVGCGYLLARRRCYRKGRHHGRCRHDYEALIPHPFAKLPVWGFVGWRSPLRLESCLVCKVFGHGYCCDGGGGGRGERS